jgi:hypothetical protein
MRKPERKKEVTPYPFNPNPNEYKTAQPLSPKGEKT